MKQRWQGVPEIVPESTLYLEQWLKEVKMMKDTFRIKFADLTKSQIAEQLTVKLKAEELEALFDKALADGSDPRLIATAKTYLEISIMLAVKAITIDRTQDRSVDNKGGVIRG